MHKIEQQMRDSIAEFLPNAMRKTIKSYIQFSKAFQEDDSDNTSKTFKDHHDACKVCIAHIELLIKLAKWADIPPPELESEIENAVIRSVLENARAELKK